MVSSTLDSLLTVVEPSLAPSGGEDQVDVESVLDLAAPNGLEYAVVENLRAAELRGTEAASRREALSETITTIDESACKAGVDYALIKDCNTVPHFPRDIDIFVDESDKEAILDALTEAGYEIEQTGQIETTVISDHGIPVDVYTRIQYFGMEFVDVDFLLDDTRRRTVYGTEYRGLSNEGELLVNLVHSFFGHRRVTLLDFVHLKRINRDGIDEAACLEHAERMGWKSTYLYFRSVMTDLEKKLRNGEPVSFPHLFDLRVMIRSIDKLDAEISGYAPSVMFSLWLDGVKLRIENTWVERAIKRAEPLRKMLLRIAYASRRARGDRYS